MCWTASPSSSPVQYRHLRCAIRWCRLDALCDLIVTCVGLAYMMGYDLHAALEVVNASNWSKFEDGQPVFDEQGKIQKGKNYRAPSLEAFA